MEQYLEFVKNHPYLFGALAVILYMLISNLVHAFLSGLKTIGPVEATRLINRDAALVLDVRDKTAFSKGHIVDAVNVPTADVAKRITELEAYRERPVIVCCNDGFASPDAAKPLAKSGFNKIYVLAGGINEWRNSNFPLIRS